ncbi:MAG: TetR/AcrR family transcriptional regulator [Solirubrobacteraceae bacterium]|nr:TetR/AcrR family transcriptional regulator [Solirubrobacteraceae bacterium]
MPNLPQIRHTPTSTAISDAALKLFAETDPRRVTVRQIATAANVSVGSVYVHFGSKDGLYLAILDEALQISARYTMNRRWSESPLQRIFNVGEAYFRFATEHPEAFRLIVQRTQVETDTPELAAAAARVERRIERETAAIVEDLAAAMDAGELMRMPEIDVLRYLWASWAGVLTMMVREDRFKIEAEDAHRILGGAQWILARGMRPD